MNENVSRGTELNPYAPPLAPAGPRGEPNAVEKVRYELLATETRLRSLGTGYFLVTVFSFFFGYFAVAIGEPKIGYTVLGALPVLFLLAVLLHQRSLQRRLLYVLGGLALLFFPLGTFLSVWLLYLLGSARGRRVLTPEYREIIAATPHIRYRSPWLLGIAILFLAICLPVLFVYLNMNG